MEIEDYLYGDCHLFAIALSLVKGYKIECAFDYDYELESKVLIHAYCVNDQGKKIDADGFKEDILSDYDYNDPFFELLEINDLQKLVSIGFLHDFESGQLKELLDYIKKNISNYE